MAEATTEPSADTSSSESSSADAKIIADLNMVSEKMDLCDSMLHPGDGSPAPSLKNNESLLAVIGFLEACAPRMVELVEVAAQGALGEATLVRCLEINDRLQKLLADIETVSMTETTASTTAASAPSSGHNSELDEFDDLLLDDSAAAGGGKTTGEADPFVGNTDVLTPVPMGKTTGEDEDPFAGTPDVLSPTPAAEGEDAKKPAAVAPAAAEKNDDDFDSFFEERTSKS